MKKIRLLIADADAAHIANVRRVIAQTRSIEVVDAATSGRRALDMLSAYRPDVLLTDVNLPEMDGIELLKQARRMRTQPTAIVCTRFYSDLCVERASRNGAAYFLYKPIDYRRLPGVILDCCTKPGDTNGAEPKAAKPDPALAVKALLQAMGISPKLAGRQYILEAMLCLFDDRRLLNNLTNGLYEQVALRTRSTPQRIERAIRGAISAGYDRGGMKRFFNRRPSNRAFLHAMLLRMDDSARPAADREMADVDGNVGNCPGGVL